MRVTFGKREIQGNNNFRLQNKNRKEIRLCEQGKIHNIISVFWPEYCPFPECTKKRNKMTREKAHSAKI